MATVNNSIENSNIRFTQETYEDYRASAFFRSIGVTDLTATKKMVTITSKAGVKELVPLVHLSGTFKQDGKYVDIDLWPRMHATREDLKSLPDEYNDFVFRIGYNKTVTEDGEEIWNSSSPKFMGYFDQNNRLVKLSGEKRKYIAGDVDAIDNISEVAPAPADAE